MLDNFKKKIFAVVVVFSAGAICGVFISTILRYSKKPLFYEKRRGRGCRLTNPLLECEQYQGGDRQLDLVKSKLVQFINEKQVQDSQLQIAVYVRDLNNGPWIGINEKENFIPASLLKVPIMIAYFKLAEAAPEILDKEIKYDREISDPYKFKYKENIEVGQAYTVSELIRRMIIYSDNVAKDLLLLNIATEDLLRVHKDLHIVIPDVRKVHDLISVKEYAAFFRILYNAAYLNEATSEKALELLTKTVFKRGIVAGVPSGVKVAHKYGICKDSSLRIQEHDCGIVYFPGSPYLLCVMTKGKDEPELEGIISEISRIVYEHKLGSSIKNQVD